MSRSPNALADITVVSVACDSAAMLGGLLDGLGDALPVVVVDNASVDDSAALARRRGARVLPLTRNAGFGRACNIGAEAATTPYLLFINPDARIRPDQILALHGRLRERTDLFAVAPMLGAADRAPAQKTKNYLDVLDLGQTPELTSLSGSAFMTRRDAFLSLGGFDANIFLYYEEDDLFWRARNRGYKLELIEAMIIDHAHGRSCGPSARKIWLRAYHGVLSRFYLARKYGLPAQPVREARRGLARLLGGLATCSTARMIMGVASVAATIDASLGRFHDGGAPISVRASTEGRVAAEEKPAPA